MDANREPRIDANNAGIRRTGERAVGLVFGSGGVFLFESYLKTSLLHVIIFGVSEKKGPEILFRKEVYTIVGGGFGSPSRAWARDS
jgi:hypothetical protein